MLEAIPRHIVTKDWMTLVFVIVLLLLVYAKTRFSEEFYNFTRILWSKKYFAEGRRTLKLIGELGYTLFLAQSLCVALGLYYIYTLLRPVSSDSYVVFLKIAVLYLVFIVGKYLVEKIIATLFDIETFLNDYIFFKLTYKNFLGLLLLPFLVIVTYLWSGSILFFKSFFVIFVSLNLVFLGFYYKKRRKQIYSNVFYFILYLCTFEIAPYYILYKAIA